MGEEGGKRERGRPKRGAVPPGLPSHNGHGAPGGGGHAASCKSRRGDRRTRPPCHGNRANEKRGPEGNMTRDRARQSHEGPEGRSLPTRDFTCHIWEIWTIKPQGGRVGPGRAPAGARVQPWRNPGAPLAGSRERGSQRGERRPPVGPPASCDGRGTRQDAIFHDKRQRGSRVMCEACGHCESDQSNCEACGHCESDQRQ